jgi:hypothetical protein
VSNFKVGDEVICVGVGAYDLLDEGLVYRVAGVPASTLWCGSGRITLKGHRVLSHPYPVELFRLFEQPEASHSPEERLATLQAGARETILGLSGSLDKVEVRKLLSKLDLLTEDEKGLDPEYGLPTWEGAVLITEDGDVAVLVGEERGKPGRPWALFEYGGGDQPYDHLSYSTVANYDPTVINRAIFPE